MAVTGSRPLSPHLGIYRRGPHMIASIIHRISGDGLAIVGTLVLLWWLGSAAAGAAAYDSFIAHASAWYGKGALLGLTWAFLQHATSGMRHLLLDTGAGYELKANRMWSLVTLLLPLVLTAATWAFIMYGRI